MRAPYALFLALFLPAIAVTQPPDEDEVLVWMGDQAFDPADPEAQRRFGMTADPPNQPVGWVLQLRRRLTPAESDRIRTAYGLSLESYVAGQAYLVWMSQLDIDELARTEKYFYRAHVRYSSSLRIPAWLHAMADLPGSIQLRITPFEAQSVQELADEIQELDPQSVDILQVRGPEEGPHVVVEIPLDLVNDLAAIEGVQLVEDLPYSREDLADMAAGHQPSTRGTADPTTRVDARSTRDVSASRSGPKPRHWTEVFGGVGFGGDSNVLLIGEGVSPSGSKRDTHFLGYAGVDYRLTDFEPDGKTWELGLQGHATGINQSDIDEASRFDWRVGGYFDWEIRPVRQTSENRPRYRTGLMLRHSEVRLDGGAFATINQAVFAGSIAFRQEGECELDRLFAFVSFEDIDDRLPESDPALNREGRNTGIGIRGSLGPKGKNLQFGWNCHGGGTFRKLFLQNYWTMHGGYEHRWERTDGTEFRRRVDVVRLEGHWPIVRAEYKTTRDVQMYRSRVILDVDLSYTGLDHSEASIFSSGEARDEDTRVADIGLIFPLVLQSEYFGQTLPRNYTDVSLRIGGQYLENRSNIDQFDYDRTVYGINLQVVFGHQNLEFVMHTDPDNPGSTDGDDSGSGPERPKPDGGTMMPSP